MKKLIIALLIFTFIFSLFSCNIADDKNLTESDRSSLNKQTDTLTNSDSKSPVVKLKDWSPQSILPPEYTGKAAIRSALRDGSIPEGGEFVNITDDMLEKDYDNFSVMLDYDEYKISSNIILKLKNENLKPFHYFKFPLIERYDEENNNWQPIMYFALNTHRERTDNYWQTSTTGTIRFNMMLLYLTENYNIELPLGTYRFAVFCGGKTFYSPEFTLIQ